MLKSVLNSQLVAHLESRHLSPSQVGFRKNISCKQYIILNLNDQLLKTIDDKSPKFTALLSLDISRPKAFDSVHRSLLSSKLKKLFHDLHLYLWIPTEVFINSPPVFLYLEKSPLKFLKKKCPAFLRNTYKKALYIFCLVWN